MELDNPVRTQSEAWSGRCRKPQGKNCSCVSMSLQWIFFFTFDISLQCNASHPLQCFLPQSTNHVFQEVCKIFPTEAVFKFNYIMSLYTTPCVILTVSFKICYEFTPRNFETFQYVTFKILLLKRVIHFFFWIQALVWIVLTDWP